MESVKKLKEDGYLILKNLLSIEDLEEINKDINSVEKVIPDCVEYKDEIISKTLTRFEIECMPAVSAIATKAILSSSLPEIASNYFGEDARVGELSVRKSILTSIDNPFSKTTIYSDGNILKTHVDYVEGVALYAFTSLNESSLESGPTFLFSKTHLLSQAIKGRFHLDKKADGSKNTTFVKEEDYIHAQSIGSNLIIADKLSPGDTLIFDLRIWHGRMPAISPGRTIMLTKFFPRSIKDEGNDLLIRSSTLDLLNEREREVLTGIKSDGFQRKRVATMFYGSRTTNKYADNLIGKINFSFRRLGGLKHQLKKIFFSQRKNDGYPNLKKLFVE